MCGIAGTFAYDRAEPARDPTAELSAVSARMALRGPDGDGLWCAPGGRLGLAHRRLSIIDLDERAAQPMRSADGRLAISFNGEIYNYRALRAELRAEGARFVTESDTEVLLQLYAARGTDMLGALRGMYAFAIWDGARETLLLARDPHGIKPLYYADDGRVLRFASQVKALLAGGGVSRALDPAGLVGLHLFGSVPEPWTLYDGIRALPAGTWLEVDAGGVGEPAHHRSIAALHREAGAAPVPSRHEVREALIDSVRDHMVADVPVGAFLSSGVDSAALVALMAERSPEPVRAITLSFDEFAGTADDEAPLASEVARRYGVEHSVRRVGREELEGDLPAILDAMDQPTIDGINTFFVSKATRELGLKVAVSGLGGDELWGGYPSFAELPRWRRLLAPSARLPALGARARRFGEPWLRLAGLSPKLGGMLELGGSWAGAYLLRRGIFMPWELPEVLGSDVAEEGLERLEPLAHIEAQLEPDPGSDFARVATLESALYMRNQLLRDTDWASMAHSLEVRVPLVDAVLLRAVAGASARGEGKRMLAAAPAQALPATVVDRAKTGFTTPIARWMQRIPELDGWRRVPRLHDAHCHWSRKLVVALATRWIA